jgi:hypothetical protein
MRRKWEKSINPIALQGVGLKIRIGWRRAVLNLRFLKAHAAALKKRWFLLLKAFVAEIEARPPKPSRPVEPPSNLPAFRSRKPR